MPCKCPTDGLRLSSCKCPCDRLVSCLLYAATAATNMPNAPPTAATRLEPSRSAELVVPLVLCEPDPDPEDPLEALVPAGPDVVLGRGSTVVEVSGAAEVENEGRAEDVEELTVAETLAANWAT